MIYLILWGDVCRHVERVLKQQFLDQASCARCEALCPHNEFLTADVVEKRSKVQRPCSTGKKHNYLPYD